MMGCISQSQQTIQNVEINAKIIDTRGSMTIFYGTTSGTSSRLAFEFAKEAQDHHFNTRGLKYVIYQVIIKLKVINLGEFDENILKSSQLVIFFVASYGSGGPTADAEQFFEWMMSPNGAKQQLTHLNYIVFGLGNKNYEDFCGMGVKTDRFLEAIGANRIYSLGKADSSNESTQRDFYEWKIRFNLWQILEQAYPIYQINEADQVLEDSLFLVTETQEKKDILPIESIEDFENYDFNTKEYLKSYILPVEDIKELKQNHSFQNSTILISLNNQQMINNGIIYQTAGNLIAYPENDDLCNYLGWNQDAVIKLEKNPKIKFIPKQPFPNPITLKDYLQKFCDFMGQVNRFQIYELSKLTNNQDWKKELEFLSSFEGQDQFEEQIINKRHCLLSLLIKYHITTISISNWLKLAQPLRPRTYTIASSQKKHPNLINIVISSLIIQNSEQARLGVFSKYVQNLMKIKQNNKSLNLSLRVQLKESSFIFPMNPYVPIMLVATGAGVAPMMALIQERDYYLEQDKLEESPFQGQMSLYFGCRRKQDLLFEQELQSYLDLGTLHTMKVAYSQEQERIHITHLLNQDLIELNNHFKEFKGIMYICGSQQMGKDVFSIIGQMFKQVQKVQPYLAFKKVNELEQNKQIIKEIWG